MIILAIFCYEVDSFFSFEPFLTHNLTPQNKDFEGQLWWEGVVKLKIRRAPAFDKLNIEYEYMV